MPDIYYILTMQHARKLQKKKGEVFSESIRKTESHKKEEKPGGSHEGQLAAVHISTTGYHLFCGFQLRLGGVEAFQEFFQRLLF